MTLKNVGQGHLHLINSSSYPNVLSKLIWLTLISPLFSVLEMSAFYICCIKYIQVHFRRYLNGGKQREQSDLGPYCLQYRLPMNIREEQAENVMTSEKRVKIYQQVLELPHQYHSRRKWNTDQKQYEPLIRCNH